jgi:hypothetical protein
MDMDDASSKNDLVMKALRGIADGSIVLESPVSVVWAAEDVERLECALEKAYGKPVSIETERK